MTRSELTQEQNYLAAFRSFENNGASQDPIWLKELRKKSIGVFHDLGFPIARRGNEEWKYTDVLPLAREPFQTSIASEPLEAVKPDQLDHLARGDTSSNRLVFLDGAYSPQLSRVRDLAEGCEVLDLAEAVNRRPGLLEPRLGRLAAVDGQPFTALNSAFIHHGAFIHIPKGVELKEPINIVFLARGKDIAFHPRVLVIADEASKATIIETYMSPSHTSYFSNAVTEVFLGPGAGINHYRVQRQSNASYHIGTTHVNMASDAAYTSVALDLGGRLVRNNLEVYMDGKGASCTLKGLYIVSGQQHVDNQVIIDHAKPYTSSRELYKGILDGHSRAVFHGSIIVERGAQKVEARQEDRNLLLSDQCEADSKPAFWIYADDVKCSHGASCGRIDEQALFYCRSRGLDEQTAKRLLISAFAAEIIDAIRAEPLRSSMEGLALQALPSVYQ